MATFPRPAIPVAQVAVQNLELRNADNLHTVQNEMHDIRPSMKVLRAYPSWMFTEPPEHDDLTTGEIPIFGVYKDLASVKSSKLPMQKLTAVVSARETKNRLLSYWASISVVLALLATIAGANFFAPPTSRGHGSEQTFACLSGGSFALTYCGVIMSTIYYAVVNQLPSDAAVIKFVEKYSKVLPLPTTFFVLGTGFYIIAFLYGGWMIYDYGYGTVITALVFLIMFLAIMALWISMQAFSIASVDEYLKIKAQKLADEDMLV